MVYKAKANEGTLTIQLYQHNLINSSCAVAAIAQILNYIYRPDCILINPYRQYFRPR